MIEMSNHFPVPTGSVMEWYRTQLKEVRARYPDVNKRAHPKVREFASLFNSPETAYDDMIAWILADSLENS
jgi:hypothetical protein